MFIVSVLAFFAIIFLLTGIVVALAWMVFLKSKREKSETEAAASVLLAASESRLFREERLSTISVFDSLLTQLEPMAALKDRIAQAGLDWPVGRVLAGMLLLGAVTLAALSTFLPLL